MIRIERPQAKIFRRKTTRRYCAEHMTQRIKKRHVPYQMQCQLNQREKKIHQAKDLGRFFNPRIEALSPQIGFFRSKQLQGGLSQGGQNSQIENNNADSSQSELSSARKEFPAGA